MVKQEISQLRLNSVTLENLSERARTLLDFAGDCDVWIFEGEMGGGKTTLIKKICELLKIVDMVNSPTFSLVNEYASEDGDTVYHFDFYRIESEKEAVDIGCEEYFYSGHYCFVEWPSKVPSLLPDEYVKVEISVVDDTTRLINVTKYG